VAVTQVIDKTGRVIEYDRRRPEKSVFYRVVAEHIETLFAEAEQNGSGYPEHVKREFERFLSCGILSAGFARIQCSKPGCTFERLVAFSCKGRCICPSCVSRRMADCASHLVDEVMPIAPYRQWTLSLPYDVRFRVGYDKNLLSCVLSIFLRTVFSYQRLRARRLGVKRPLTGSITLCQRYGSILQFTPHFHSWIPDGVFSENEDGELSFHPLPPPDDADVEDLLLRIAQRVDTLLSDTDDDAAIAADDDTQALLAAQAAAISPPVRTRGFGIDSPRCAFFEGYSLHANLATAPHERSKLERLLRYGLRPPFAQKRLSLTDAGKVRLKLRKPFHTGQTEIVLDPLDFLRRLVATIPPKRMNMVRFHGIFAPRANARPLLKPLLPPKKPAASKPTTTADGPSSGDTIDDHAVLPPRYRRPWHELLKRVFDIDLVCAVCGHKMHRISHIEDPATISRILGHLGLPTQHPQPAPARDPPQLDFFDLDLFDGPDDLEQVAN